MKLICCLVRQLLAKPGDRPPWVSRHVESCPGCAAEARAYDRLTEAVRQRVGELGDCPVGWESVRAAIERAPSQPARVRRSSVPAYASAVALVAMIAVGVWLTHIPSARPAVDRIARTPHEQTEAREPEAKPKSGPEVEAPRPSEQQAVDDSAKARSVTPPARRTAPVRRRIIIPPKKKYYAAKPEREVVPKPTDSPEVAAAPRDEHVIQVVGVNLDQGNDCFYVIDEVTPQDAESAVDVAL